MAQSGQLMMDCQEEKRDLDLAEKAQLDLIKPQYERNYVMKVRGRGAEAKRKKRKAVPIKAKHRHVPLNTQDIQKDSCYHGKLL